MLNLRLPGRTTHDTLKLKVDTGAEGNILPLRIYRRMFPRNLDADGFPRADRVSKRPGVKLSAYNGGEIKQHGAVTLKCSYKNSGWSALEFYIAESDGPGILGLASCKHLDIVRLQCDDIGVNTATASQQQPKPASPGQSFKDVTELKAEFPKSFDTLGDLKGTYRLVADPSVSPVVHGNRKYAIQRKLAIKQELGKMEAMGVIARVHEPTDWVSSLVYTEKKDGGIRICLDPKDLNRALKRPIHKTPTLEEITHHLSGASVFSKMDAKNGYWSIKLDDDSSKLTTFNSPFGRYRFLRLPFGLVVSQDVFQQRMDAILEKCPGCIGIVDDVCVYGRDQEEHDRHLINLMKVAEKEGLVFNSKKCVIRVSEIPFFGMRFSSAGAQPDPDRIEAIRSLPAPENVTELKEFLGIATYMSSFVPRLSHHSAALRDLLKQDTEFAWTASHQEAFQQVKDLICQETTLAYFDTNKDTVLQVDSSLKGLGAVIMQDGRPIAFASKALTSTESRYANIERELLAVVYGCERFHTYLYGKPFTVQSDHKPLEMIQLKNLHAAPPRLQRMLLRLQQYDVLIQYQPVKTLLLADGLSRLQGAEENGEVELDVRVNLVQFSHEKVQQLREETAMDEELGPLRDLIIDGWPDQQRQLAKLLKPYWSYRDELSIDNGIILKGSDQVLIPKSMRPFILESLHAGHLGRDKCRLRAKTSVFWNGISNDIERYVASCSSCQKHAGSQRKEPLMPKEVPPCPWHTIATDFFEINGVEYLLVADQFSKFPFVKRMGSSATSKSTIAYFKELLSLYGVPEIVYSDNGTQYTSYEFRKFAERWLFQHITSSPIYPQSNGFIERTVETVKNVMKKAMDDKTEIELALLCLRTTPIADNIPSPIELLSGRRAKSNIPLATKRSPTAANAREALIERQEKQKRDYDRTAGPELPALYTGQRVRVQDPGSGLWMPATILERCSEPRSYVVGTPNGGRLRRNRRHITEFGKL